MTHRSMRRKALHMSAEFETPVSLLVVLKGSMPSSSKQFIKTVHQNSSLKRLAEAANRNSLSLLACIVSLIRYSADRFS